MFYRLSGSGHAAGLGYMLKVKFLQKAAWRQLKGHTPQGSALGATHEQSAVGPGESHIQKALFFCRVRRRFPGISSVAGKKIRPGEGQNTLFQGR